MRPRSAEGEKTECGEGKVRPLPGNAPHEPAGRPGSFFTSFQERLRRSLPRHSGTAGSKNTGAPRWRFLRHVRIYRSDVGLYSNPSPGWSRCLPPAAPDPSPRTCREDHALLIVSMSSGRLFLDRVARQQSPSPLHRYPQINMHSSQARAKGDVSTLLRGGHFYFALTAPRGALTALADCASIPPYARLRSPLGGVPSR